MFSPSRDRRAIINAAESVRTSVNRVIEPLESRTLLAASVNGDELVIAGTNGRDNIEITTVGGGQIVVSIDGDDQTFDGDNFRSIRVKARDGNDTIRINEDDGKLGKRVLIVAGNGNDEIHGGTTRDTVKAGAGDDVVYGNGGDDVLRGGADDDIIYGGAGEDKLRGEDGDDTLGGDREDRLNFLPADRTTPQQTIPINKGFDDKLDGGAGNDWLLGGWESDYDPQNTEGGVDPRPWNPGDNGADRMTGGPGNDVIDARGRNDTITDKEAGDTVPIERYINFIPEPVGFEYAYHNHAQMEILLDGRNIEMPIGISDWADLDNDLYPLFHKHWDPDNDQTHQIHMHSAEDVPFTGRDVFQAWGVSFSNRHIGEYRMSDGVDSIEAEVNGETMSMAEFADYEIQDGDDIFIRISTND